MGKKKEEEVDTYQDRYSVYRGLSSDVAAEIEAIIRHRKEKGLDPEGQPILDPTPMAPPIGYRKQVSIFEQVRQAMRAHQLEELEQMEETLDQADDYAIDDDAPDPLSKWEIGSQYSVRELREMVEVKKREVREKELASAAKGAPGGGLRPPPEGDKGGSGGPPPEKNEPPVF